MPVDPISLRPRRALRGGLLFVLGSLLVPALALAQAAPAKPIPKPIPKPAAATPSAESVPGNPYAAMVPVDDESDKSRDKGMRLALIEVLKRVVGRSDAATSEILARAPSLVQQYAFLRDEATDTLRFKAAFDQAAVEAALRAEGLPVFGVDPDVVEAWITEVHGLRDAADYSRVLQLFGHLRGVRRVDVEGLHDDSLRLRMIVEGGVERAAQMAEAGGVLRGDGTGNYVLAH